MFSIISRCCRRAQRVRVQIQTGLDLHTWTNTRMHVHAHTRVQKHQNMETHQKQLSPGDTPGECCTGCQHTDCVLCHSIMEIVVTAPPPSVTVVFPNHFWSRASGQIRLWHTDWASECSRWQRADTTWQVNVALKRCCLLMPAVQGFFCNSRLR